MSTAGNGVLFHAGLFSYILPLQTLPGLRPAAMANRPGQDCPVNSFPFTVRSTLPKDYPDGGGAGRG